MESLYYNRGRTVADSYADVCDAFSLALLNSNTSPIYIMVDALDECQDAIELIKFLVDGGRKFGNNVKLVRLIFLTRENANILQAFCCSEATLIIRTQVVNKSIEGYVKARVAKMKVLAGTKLGDSVMLSVSAASEGLWLYACLILDEIQQMPNTAIIRRQLGNIPRGLHSSTAYARIWHRRLAATDLAANIPVDGH